MTFAQLKEYWIEALDGNDDSRDIVLKESESFFRGYLVKRKTKLVHYHDDMVQEMLMYLWKRFYDYNSEYSPTTFLHYIYLQGITIIERKMARHERMVRFDPEGKIKYEEEFFIVLEGWNKMKTDGQPALFLSKRNLNEINERIIFTDGLQLKDLLRKFLTSRTFGVMCKYYYEGETYKNIGAGLGITKQGAMEITRYGRSSLISNPNFVRMADNL